jgi:hypothetical protein
MLTVAMLIVWAAAVYRLALSLAQPRTLWRTSLTAVILAMAVAPSLYAFRQPIDQLVQLPNLAGLLSRLVVTVGLGFLLVFLHALRLPAVPRSALTIYSVTTVAVAVALVLSWILGPFHRRELDDLLAVPSVATALYCVSFWAFLGVVLALTAWTCLPRRRTVSHQDLAREVSLLLTAFGSLVGLAVLLLWSLSLISTVAGADGSAFNRLGDRLMPIPIALVAGGVVSLLVVPYLVSLIVTWRRWSVLRPLWAVMVERYPHVHLEARPRGGLLSRLQFRVERMIIEILDALRIAPVATPRPGDAPVDAVARSISEGVHPQSGWRAGELLDHPGSRDGDVDQLVRLARAYKGLHHAAE